MAGERPEKIGVVGAGLMGAEIALVFALAGHEVADIIVGEFVARIIDGAVAPRMTDRPAAALT